MKKYEKIIISSLKNPGNKIICKIMQNRAKIEIIENYEEYFKFKGIV